MYPKEESSFASHTSLSSVLIYSSKTIKRIKTLIKNKDAYIFSGFPSADDIKLSNLL
jgi:hypothetical protein